ncbi:MAG: Hsp20 family protein [Thiobacillus sp.]|nr:Hsp20 family protein [Thiobacillus sp.]
MKTAVSQSCLLASLLAVAGIAHAGDCPDHTAAKAGDAIQATTLAVPAQAYYANAWAELARLQATMEGQFEAMNALPTVFVPTPAFMLPTPVSTLQQTQDGYRVEIPLPGFKPEDVHVRVDGQSLSVTAETDSTRKIGDKDVQRHSSRTFAETLTFPASVQASKLKQSFENGVLILSIPENGNTT